MNRIPSHQAERYHVLETLSAYQERLTIQYQFSAALEIYLNNLKLCRTRNSLSLHTFVPT